MPKQYRDHLDKFLDSNLLSAILEKGTYFSQQRRVVMKLKKCQIESIRPLFEQSMQEFKDPTALSKIRYLNPLINEQDTAREALRMILLVPIDDWT